MARMLFLTALAAAAGTFLLGAPACDSDGSGTTGRRIALEVTIAATPESRQFTNAQGWNVTITKAAVATGALYFYDGETLFASRGPTVPRRSPEPSRAFGIKVAHAHPGHYVPGSTRGEMRLASSADLLAGASLGMGDGITGPVRSATFSFGSPAAGPAAAELGADVIVLEGSATKAAETRVFRAEVLPDEVKDTKGLTQIEGCPFVAAEMDADGVVAIGINLKVWLDQVAFDDVPPSPDGKPVTLPDGLARNQLVRGTKAGLAYTFRYTRRSP